MNKLKRQKFILSLIKQKCIKNQKQIVEALKTNGFFVTQATISRDIKNLLLKKNITKNGLVYEENININNKNNIEETEFLKIIFKNSVSSISSVDSLIVIHTIPGSASTLAFHLDKNNINKDILGTIAGDDTVLVILKKSSFKKKWIKIFKNYL